MDYFKKIILAGSIISLVNNQGWGQYKLDKAILINKEAGLPSNSIWAIQKSKDGFMWIGTSEGLCRFDGQQVKVFREGPDLKHSLFENAVAVLLPVNDEMWIGTPQGISVLNTRDYTFRHYQLENNGKSVTLDRRFDQNVTALFKDRSGKIWIGTRNRGVCSYDEKTDNFRFYPLEREKFPPLVPALGAHYSIINIEQSGKNDSIIWAGTTGGLQEINKYTGLVRLYTFPQPSKDYQVALNAFRRLYYHDDGLLYVGSWGAGVNVFDPETKTFTPLVAKNPDGRKLIKAVISKIARKSDHEIWISASNGLGIYDTEQKDVTWLRFNKPGESAFYALNYIDESNRVWQADNAGLRYFDPVMQQFSKYSYKHLATVTWPFSFFIVPEDSGNTLTVCPRFADGLYQFNMKTGDWTKTPFPAGISFTTERDVVRGFVRLPSGDYVISSDKGLFIFSKKENKIKPLGKDPSITGPSRRGELMLDRKGNIWLPDDIQGLIKWDTRTGKYRIYRNEFILSDNTNTFGRVENLFEDSRGNIWFQAGLGLGVYIAGRDSILAFPYSKNENKSFPYIESFAEDRKGRIWISGSQGWLGYALSTDPSRAVIHKLNVRSKGLAGTLVQLATDPQGNVWGYNNRELVKINATDDSFTSYSFEYGMESGDFFHFSFHSNGDIIFGGRDDIIIVNPSDLKRNTEIPVPYISEMEVMNKPFNFYNSGKPIRLKFNQNYFSIGFSAKAYTMPKDVKFRYRLNGFDDWTEMTGRRFASYTNVPGGNYIFQLQAANNEGAWNKDILELPVHIGTPFWNTWWFRISVLVLIGISGYWLYRFRIAQVQRKQQLKSEYEKKLANVEMSALLAQMNPHFLFNSLNSIDSYIIRNESKKASEYLNNFARLMRLILQNSRSNYISLKDELEALELYLQMESLRFNNKFNYSIHVDNTLDQSSTLIPPMLIQPYVENAIWHGLMHKTNGEAGKVELELYKTGDNLLCIIKDNGIGRKKAAELGSQKYKNNKRSMGTKITEERIEIINKLYNINASVNILDMQNEKGEASGTKVELNIPI